MSARPHCTWGHPHFPGPGRTPKACVPPSTTEGHTSAQAGTRIPHRHPLPHSSPQTVGCQPPPAGGPGPSLSETGARGGGGGGSSCPLRKPLRWAGFQLGGGGEGGFGWPPPPPMVPLWSPPKAGQKNLKLTSSWHRRRRSKMLAFSIKHWKGRRGGRGLQGGGYPTSSSYSVRPV